MFNFFGESYRIRAAYENAIKKGVIKLADVPGGSLESVEILQMATKKVRDMLPNYNYVPPFVKGTRRSPLGNFVGWTSEQIRTFPNALKTAIEETKSPIFAKMGYQRLVWHEFNFSNTTTVSGIWCHASLWVYRKKIRCT